ncbi:hypothetical protein [Archangium lansingense]|uniref:Uncharacterized protein n=1 Tax=Archangium lansingense TaxID=2995310 RepID=A0ABT4ACZ8_9BACT|nr:hypothetical protein [Archangium lansinium]MCY1079451.1 hypothetical protein [Archangium lansinium]
MTRNLRFLVTINIAPHERNPRVPQALSAVCMRMLAKKREARFPDYVELCGALDAALAAAEKDARWDVPLMDPDAPDATPTLKVPGMGPRAGEEQAGLAWKADRPRRGRKAARKPQPVPERAVPAPLPAKVAEPPAPAKVAQAAASPAEALVAVLAEVAPEHAWEGLPPPVPESALPSPPPVPEAPAVARAAPAPRRAPGLAQPAPPRKARGPLRWALARIFPTSLGMLPVRAAAVASLPPAALLVVAVGALALASAGAWVVHTRPAPGSPSTVPSAASPPAEPLRGGSTAQACAVREVASAQEWPEAGVGTAFYLAPTPAPVFATMLRKEDSRLRLEETPAPQLQRKGMRARFVEKCVGAACCALFGACTGAPARPTPKPEDCSSKALVTMKELDIDIDDEAKGSFPVVGDSKPVTVKEFTTFSLLRPLGKLNAGTVLSGRLIFGESRVYGRFTQAKTLGGRTYSVCFELQYGGQRGVEIERDGGPDSAVVFSSADVRAVDRFE